MRLEPEAEDSPQPCEGFRWLGQSLKHCDRCSLPYWLHTHEERLKKGGSPFSDAPLVFEPITKEQADAVRVNWGRS